MNDIPIWTENRMTEPDLDAHRYDGNDSALLKFTNHTKVVFNSFHQPVIYHEDARHTVVEPGDWVFRRNGQLFACSDVIWSSVVKPLLFQLGEARLLIEGHERIEQRISHHIPEHYEAGYNPLEDWAKDADAVISKAHAWRKRERNEEDGDALDAAVEKMYPSEDYL